MQCTHFRRYVLIIQFLNVLIFQQKIKLKTMYSSRTRQVHINNTSTVRYVRHWITWPKVVMSYCPSLFTYTIRYIYRYVQNNSVLLVFFKNAPLVLKKSFIWFLLLIIPIFPRSNFWQDWKRSWVQINNCKYSRVCWNFLTKWELLLN